MFLPSQFVECVSLSSVLRLLEEAVIYLKCVHLYPHGVSSLKAGTVVTTYIILHIVIVITALSSVVVASPWVKG